MHTHWNDAGEGLPPFHLEQCFGAHLKYTASDIISSFQQDHNILTVRDVLFGVAVFLSFINIKTS